MTSKAQITKVASRDGVDARVVERDYVLAHTGHVTEQMQRHYSSVDVAEKREAMEAAMNVLKAAKAELEMKKGVNSGVNCELTRFRVPGVS